MLLGFLAACSVAPPVATAAASACATGNIPCTIPQPETTGEPDIPTAADQSAVERIILDFAAAVEHRDFERAVARCTPAFGSYLKGLADGAVVASNRFGIAIVNGYEMTLKEALPFYGDGISPPDFDVTPDRPTVNFYLTFAYTDADGAEQTAGGFILAQRQEGAGYLIPGFISSL